IHTVSVRDRDKRLSIDAQKVRGDLRFLPLIAGRMELSSLTLVLPAIVIDAERISLHSTRDMAGKAINAAGEKAAAGFRPMGTIAIEGGRIVLLRSGLQGDSNQIGDVNASLEWRGLAQPVSLAGSFILRGEKTDFAIRLTAPAALAANKPSPASAKLSSRLGELTLDGALNPAGGWQFAGKTAASSPALLPLISLANWNVPLPGPLASFRLAATARINATSLALSDLKLTLDKNEFDGTLSWRLDADRRPSISGTLATRMLEIDPRTAAVLQLSGPEGGWNRRPLAIERLFGADVDLRLSATKLRFANFEVEEAGITALIKQQTGEFSLVSGRAYGGTLNGSLRLTPGPVLPALRGNLRFSRIDIAKLLRDAARSQRVSGIGDGSIEFGSAGANIEELATAAMGQLQLNISKGVLRGLDLDRALERAQTHPLSIPDEIRSGQTAFEKLEARAKVSEGVLTLEDTKLQAPQLQVDITGTVRLPSKTLNLDVDAARIATTRTTSASEATPPRLKFDLTGSWDAPLLMIDPETLIMRSEAAAPLIRSLQRLRGGRSENQ
ncbi:MAG: AsmA family protein, partial [Alphaproteobacteria bacterium]|nr:AsmA family protein [Alphaproteobacteria bacterium]